MLKLLFKKEEFSDYLFQEGSVFFSLLEGKEIKRLKKVFSKYHKQDPSGFYATTHLDDKSLRKSISDQIIRIIAPKLEEVFENINVLGGAFISKSPGEKGILPLHQDWNIVDEEKARSYNLWIPLCDVNEFNGAMRILARSHRKEKTFRGPNIPPSLYKISKEVDKHMHTLNMNSGEALIYDHALWHSSPQNQSEELRLAIVLGVIPKDAEMKYYHLNEENVDEYDSHANFFFENDRENGHKSLKLNQSIPFKIKPLSKEDFNRIYLNIEALKEEQKVHVKLSFIDSIRKFFKTKTK